MQKPTLRRIRLRLMTWLEPLLYSDEYRLPDTVREKAIHDSRWPRKRARTLAALLIAVLLILYLLSGSPLPATFHRPHIPYDERSCDHPVSRLVHDAQKSFNATVARQSKSLAEAVTEYKRRYRMPPPPGFDKWYEFASRRSTVMVDEFDTIYHAILPFWGLTPSVIRARVREDLGYDNYLMGIIIRKGRPIHLVGGQESAQKRQWQRDGTLNILKKFAQWLPEMDLPFNEHDEPRVIVAHEDLHRMATAGKEVQARLNRNSRLVNYFLKGDIIDPIPGTWKSRYNDIEKQETWLTARLSCPPETPARDLDSTAPDNTSAYAVNPLGFVFNQTAASDICLNPSLRHRLGVFERPNRFKVTNELVPMFSMSRLSASQDITVPSPYNYERMTDYDVKASIDWEKKKPQLYWRGSTTGGNGRKGAWRNLERQRIIANLTQPSSAQYVLQRMEHPACDIGGDSGWELQRVEYPSIKSWFNTRFVWITGCEEEDCAEQGEFFGTPLNDDPSNAPSEPPEEAWKYRYLLDMDGHSYSGRFVAFMRSNSLPMKVAFFREWHDNVLVPWVHYVPLNKDVDEVPELIRFFEQDTAGQKIAKTIAQGGQAWADRVLRNEDMEVYMFRLLLE